MSSKHNSSNTKFIIPVSGIVVIVCYNLFYNDWYLSNWINKTTFFIAGTTLAVALLLHFYIQQKRTVRFIHDTKEEEQAGILLKETRRLQGLSALRKNGVEAIGKILSVSDTGKLIDNDPVIDLSLEVNRPGKPTFRISAKTIVNKLTVPRIGDRCCIRYNPQNTSEMIIIDIL